MHSTQVRGPWSVAADKAENSPGHLLASCRGYGHKRCHRAAYTCVRRLVEDGIDDKPLKQHHFTKYLHILISDVLDGAKMGALLSIPMLAVPSIGGVCYDTLH